MKIYDLRSDTITKPSEEMRKAIYNAECGDDRIYVSTAAGIYCSRRIP